MRKNKDILKILLVTLVAIFLMAGSAVVFLAGHRRNVEQEKRKQEAIERLESMPRNTPTPAVAVTPTPVPTATPTPTPVITIRATFNPDDYRDSWYSTDGMVSISIYDISKERISFTFSQTGGSDGTHVSEADVTAEIGGNAVPFTFTDSFGSKARGSMTFDNGQLYVSILTKEAAEGAPVSPNVNCLMKREKPQVKQPAVSPEPTVSPEQAPVKTGDYFFPESAARYLTDEEISKYSSSELELAKNEIYARHGRKFVTQRIADYFNSKSWYQGTIEPEEFDAAYNSIFNEYEAANIEKLVLWEKKKRDAGN